MSGIDTKIEKEITDEGGRGIDDAIVKGAGFSTRMGGFDGISAGAPTRCRGTMEQGQRLGRPCPFPYR
jgi:hypothetical protein